VTPKNQKPQDDLKISSVEEFLAHARAMEREASDQYADLAEQMEVHNNREVSDLFASLSVIEGKHVDKIAEKMVGREIPHLAPWDFKWQGTTAPENPAATDAHYMMTAHHALTLALGAEERAAAFYRRVAQETDEPDVRQMALEMALEEDEHMVWLMDWLKRYPEPESNWDEDFDPPMQQE